MSHRQFVAPDAFRAAVAALVQRLAEGTCLLEWRTAPAAPGRAPDTPVPDLAAPPPEPDASRAEDSGASPP